VLHQLTGWALGRGTVLRQLTVERPRLEDIYLRLTAQDRAAGQEGSTR
jgi:ABC-2 type transport system ATP-binding protein